MQKNSNEDSLRKRYLFKLGSNLITIPIAMGTFSIIPRMLGPSDYGSFSFLVFIFTQFTSIVGSGNNFLLTRLAENSEDHGLKRFYFRLICISYLLLVILVLILSFFRISNIIFPDQDLKYIWMALLLVSCLFFSQIVRGIIDVYALTVRGEIVIILSKISALLLLFFIYLLKWHNLTALFIYRYFLVVLFIFGLIMVLKKNGISIYPKKKNTVAETKIYLREFYDYSMPLYTFSIIALLCSSVVRWLLQFFGGSIQQGFFSISDQISSFIILFSAALAPLLLREFSVSMGKNDMNRMAALFQRCIPMFYSIAAYFSVFIMFQAQKLVSIFGGSKFENAIISVTIMSLYPMFYTTSVIIFPVFYSTRQTKLLRNIGLCFYLGMLPLYFFALAPKKYFGLDLGSAGFAICMVIIAFVSYNVHLWFSTRILNLAFSSLFLHQFYSALLFALIAFIPIRLSNHLFGDHIMSFLASGLLYTACTIILIITLPSFFHITKEEIIYLFGRISKIHN